VQDLNTNYNQIGATAAAADPLIDFANLLRFLKPITYTDSYFRLQGNSLSQSYQTPETGLANQLVKRQHSDGNIVTVNPYKSYLVEDFARDLDSSVYLHNNLTYAYSAYRAESYLTRLYLHSNGTFSLPYNGEGLYQKDAYPMLTIANDLRSCSSNAWYRLLQYSST